MRESIRANLERIMTAPVELLYGWFLAWADFCCQGANGWLLLLVGCLVILLVWLFREARWSRWETSLLQASARGMALAPSPEALLSLLFEGLFQVTPAREACLYLHNAAQASWVLKATQRRPTAAPVKPSDAAALTLIDLAHGPDALSPASSTSTWHPAPVLHTVPLEPALGSNAGVPTISLPLMLEGQLAAQIQVCVTGRREARALLARVPVLRTLLTPLLAQLAAVEQHHRLAEQARAATVVSGSTQLLLTTTLTPQQLGDVLLDIVARATQSQAGLILYNAAVLGQQGIQLLAAHALDPILVKALVVTTSVRAYTFPTQASIRTLQSVPSRGDVPSAALFLQWGFRTSLEVPIIFDARPIGSIILLRQQGEFGEHHVRLCEMHASRLTLALRHHISHETVLHDYQDTLRVIVASYESSAPHLHDHASRIARLAVDLADLLGLSADEMEGIRLAAELHDVGMVGVCEKLLLQPGRLPEPKYHAIRHHPIVGAALTAPIHRPIPIAPLILHHHERYDGGGYPDGLHGTKIPLGARILALGEVVDAMLTPRSYRQALPFVEAMAKVKDASGTQLDPLVVAAFENLVRQGRHALYGWDHRC